MTAGACVHAVLGERALRMHGRTCHAHWACSCVCKFTSPYERARLLSGLQLVHRLLVPGEMLLLGASYKVHFGLVDHEQELYFMNTIPAMLTAVLWPCLACRRAILLSNLTTSPTVLCAGLSTIGASTSL